MRQIILHKLNGEREVIGEFHNPEEATRTAKELIAHHIKHCEPGTRTVLRWYSIEDKK
jgi:hypothetical protein